MEKGNSNLNEYQGTIHQEGELTSSAAEAPLDGMMAEERRTQILQIVRTAGRVRVNDLASRFSTSAVTIRNDLNELHQRGMVLRSHGGAVLPDTILRESPVRERLNANSDEKRRIGAMAATLINDGETIILDSGTTTLEIARQIKRKRGLHVITNGVNIAAELLDARDVQTFMIGGTVEENRLRSAGVSAKKCLTNSPPTSYFWAGPDAISGLGERRQFRGNNGKPGDDANRARNHSCG